MIEKKIIKDKLIKKQIYKLVIMNHEEEKFITRDGIEIFYRVWRPEQPPQQRL